MRVAIIGSRELEFYDFEAYLPPETDEIVSGGARGIDRCARRYAQLHQLKITEFLPDYEHYGRQAPLLRNIEIIAYSDLVLAFWDGKSTGTRFVIEQCKKRGKEIRIYKVKDGQRGEPRQ